MIQILQGIGGYNSISAEDIEDNPLDENLLSRQWKFVIPLLLCTYVSLQIFVGCSEFAKDNSSCSDPHTFPVWVVMINLFVVLWFICSICFIIGRMCHKIHWAHSESMGSLCATLALSIIAGSSSFLTLAFAWGGLCRDEFGYLSPAAQWPEWVTSVPLLMYMAVAQDVKANLGAKDLAVIVAMALTISVSALMNWKMPHFLNSLCLVGACLLTMSVVWFAVDAQREFESLVISNLASMESIDSSVPQPASQRYKLIVSQRKTLNSAAKKKSIAMVCFVGMPLFPSIYFFSLLQIFDDDVSVALTMIAGMLVKSVIAIIVCEGHISSFAGVEYDLASIELEDRVRDAKKTLALSKHKYYKVKFSDFKTKKVFLVDSTTGEYESGTVVSYGSDGSEESLGGSEHSGAGSRSMNGGGGDGNVNAKLCSNISVIGKLETAATECVGRQKLDLIP